jgi:hypothetical protein
MNEIKPGHNKNYMSIGVSVRTTKFATRNNSIGVRQESNPQSPTAYSSERRYAQLLTSELRFTPKYDFIILQIK